MSYSIERVDVNDLVVEREIMRLIEFVYSYPVPFPDKHLVKQITNEASMPGFFLVAKEDGKMIGCNAFVATDCTLNDHEYVAFQSCWTVTHPKHQGKKIFSNLINEAKKILKEKGAGFLYGIANERSHPIMVAKLGFTETPAVYVRIPRLPLLSKKFYTCTEPAATDTLVLNETQIFDYKKIQNPAAVHKVSHGQSWAWGKKLIKKKFGIPIPAFYVGGISLQDANDLEKLIAKIFREQSVWTIQITSCSSNSMNDCFRNWKPTQHMNGFLYYNLNMPEFTHFNAMIGAIDVF